jgi:hypothetical protein
MSGPMETGGRNAKAQKNCRKKEKLGPAGDIFLFTLDSTRANPYARVSLIASELILA